MSPTDQSIREVRYALFDLALTQSEKGRGNLARKLRRLGGKLGKALEPSDKPRPA